MTDREDAAPFTSVSAAVETCRARGTRWGIPLPKTFSALRHRNYRLYFAGQMVSLTGTWMQNVSQSWLVYQLTGSPLYLGVVSFAAGIAPILLSLWAGVIIDRVPKRKLLLITQTVAMLQAFILSADLFLGWVQPWHVVILAFVLGAVNSFDQPARQAFVVEMVGREDLMNGIALNSATFNSARIFGPTLAGITLALVGAGWCFLLNGVSFIAVIIGLWLMRIESVAVAKRASSPLSQIKEGLGYIWRNQRVRTLMGVVAVSNVFIFGYRDLLSAFVQDVLHEGPLSLGLLSAAVGTGALTGALVVASLGNSVRKGMMLTAGNLFYPIMVIVFAATRALPLSMLFLFAAGIGFMVQNTTNQTLIQTSVPDDLRGRVLSVYFLIFQGFFPLSSLLAGSIAQHWSVPIGMAFGPTIALAFGLLWLWRAPFLRKLA